MVKIKADIGKDGGVIAPEIYGHFSEHLGRCIYEGLYVGEGSTIPNRKGLRKDVVDALKKIQVPVLRWPGGCFADTYHWRDGVGENRKRIVNACWGDVVEDNSFGTHEYFELCEQLGCKTYINGNMGTGTLEEMRDWLEYMTFDGESPLSLERAANGHAAPWNVDYFGIGNEAWGYGGNMTPEYYGGKYRHYQCFLKDYNEKDPFKRICVGPSDDDYKWTQEILKTCYAYPHPESKHGYMDMLSIHYYVIPGNWEHKGSATKFSKEEYYTTMRKALYMDEILTRHTQVLEKYDSKGDITFTVDEWGCWLDVEEGTNPGFLYQQNTMRDALVASTTFDIFNKHCDRVKMACIAQMVNVLQAVALTDGEKMLLTPTYHVFDMYKVHQGATRIPMEFSDVPMLTVDGQQIPAVSGTVSKAADGAIYVSLTNISLEDEIEITIDLGECSVQASGGTILQAGMDTYNTFENPQRVAPRSFTGYSWVDGRLKVTLPAPSICTIALH